MRRATVKTWSWLLVSALVIGGAAYVETGDLAVSAMTATWACLLKTPVYYLHERFWEPPGPGDDPCDDPFSWPPWPFP